MARSFHIYGRRVPPVPPAGAEPVAPAPLRDPGAIPPDWRDLPWSELRSLAATVSGKPIQSRSEAEATIEAALSESAGS